MTAMNYSNWNTLLTSANTATGGAFGAAIPITLFIIIYSYYSLSGFQRAFPAAAFIAFVATLPLYAMGIAPAWIIVVLMVLALIGMFMVGR
jgi:hypothetical protein